VKPLHKKVRGTAFIATDQYLLTSSQKSFKRLCTINYSRHLNNNILVEELFGFRKFQTTKRAAYELINDIASAVNDKLIVGGIFCDLA
jgi:uridine kinase